jgi:hypothetical protein
MVYLSYIVSEMSCVKDGFPLTAIFLTAAGSVFLLFFFAVFFLMILVMTCWPFTSIDLCGLGFLTDGFSAGFTTSGLSLSMSHLAILGAKSRWHLELT